MTQIDTLAQTLLRQLQAEKALQDIRFAYAWPKKQGTRIKGVVAFVMVSPMSFVPASLDAAVCRAEFTISIWIYAERDLGAISCVDAFSRISDALLFGENGLCLQSISCGKVAYSNVAEAFQMESQVGMTGYCREDGEAGAVDSAAKAAGMD